MRLIKDGKISEIKSLINRLEEIDQILHQETGSSLGLKGSEFAADVKGLLETLRKQAESSTKKQDLKLVFTDDPIDLLLCGTDIGGVAKGLKEIPT